MKAIVFIGTHKSGSSREAIKAAKSLGYYTILITELTTQINQKFEYEEVDSMIYCKNDFNKMYQKIKELTTKSYEISAIVSFIDPYCETANLLAEKFGLNHFTIDAINKMEDKYKSRNCLKDTNYAPKFKTINKTMEIKKEQLDALLPVIIKYPQSQGSKDVYLVKNYEEYLDKTNLLFEKYPNGTLIIEEFLDGPQYIVETLTINGNVKIVAIIEQEINYLNGHFIVMGYNLMINPEESFYNDLEKAVRDIIKCHGLENGPSHLEIRRVKNQWKLIEINPRISGTGMNTLLEIGLGINLVCETLKLILKQDIDLNPKHKLNTFSQYIVVTKSGKLIRTTGRSRALNCKGVKYVFVKPRNGSILIPPVSMGNRYAFVIATGDNELDAKENAKYAASKINFELGPIEE